MDFTKKFVGYKGRRKYASGTPIVKDKGATNVTNIITGGGGSVDLSGYATKAELAAKQDLLVNQRNIKSVNGQSLLGEGNVLIDTSVDLSGYATKTEVAAKQDLLVNQQNIKSVNGQSLLGEGNVLIDTSVDLSNYYTREEVDGELEMKQTKLISGSNIKTVNGASLLGSGNLVITPIMDGYYTSEECDARFQPIGDYLTSVPDNYVTEDELAGKGYISAIPAEYITETELNTKLGKYYDETAMDRLLDLKANISNLKTINNIPIYRTSYGESGNIDISAGGLKITPVTSAIFDQVSAYPISNVSIGDIPVAKIDDGVEPFYISAIDREHYRINLYKQPAHDNSNKWPITGLPQTLIIRFENYDKRLWDNPYYRICLMEWKKDNDKCWHWSIPMITPRWDSYTGQILHEATPSRYAFNETYTVIAPFDGQNAQTKMFGAVTGKNWTQVLNLETKHEQRADGTMRWRFKNGHSNKLFGFAIFKYFPNKNMAGFIGQYKWARVSNIVKLRVTVDKNGYVRARVLP